MNCTFTVRRPAVWVASQRLASGNNTPGEIAVTVNIADLSMDARSILLTAGQGEYPQQWKGHYDAKYQFSPYSSYGAIPPEVDSYAPTADEIGAALLASAQWLAERRAAWEAEREAEREAKQAAQAARELLAEELAEGKTAAERLDTVSRVLAAVTSDALRDAVATIAGENGDTSAAVWKRVQKASTYDLEGI